MNIVADRALPNAAQIFGTFGKVSLKNGREINSEDVKDADILIVRSVTKVDENLIGGASHLKFVGTATAGVDHIDQEYLKSRGILFASAMGSNQESVGDYVLSTLLVLAGRYSLDLSAMSIGVVGCGCTGSQTVKNAEALGLKVIKCDPPRLKDGDLSCNATLDECLSCDFTVFHVPLIKEGPYKTFHMAGRREFNLKPRGSFLINVSRGPVVDNEALFECFKEGLDLKVWLDVFEGEPNLKCKALLPYLEGATAHIAGYSFESKYRACHMLGCAFADLFDAPAKPSLLVPGPEIEEIRLGKGCKLDLDLLSRLVFCVYDVRRDCYLFKQRFAGGKSFDELRKNYRERRELSSCTLRAQDDGPYLKTLARLGFKIKSPEN